MKRKSRLRTDDPAFDRGLDEQIARMRQMLVLMAPETGTSALGARRTGFPETPLDKRERALGAYRR